MTFTSAVNLHQRTQILIDHFCGWTNHLAVIHSSGPIRFVTPCGETLCNITLGQSQSEVKQNNVVQGEKPSVPCLSSSSAVKMPSSSHKNNRCCSIHANLCSGGHCRQPEVASSSWSSLVFCFGFFSEQLGAVTSYSRTSGAFWPQKKLVCY